MKVDLKHINKIAKKRIQGDWVFIGMGTEDFFDINIEHYFYIRRPTKGVSDFKRDMFDVQIVNYELYNNPYEIKYSKTDRFYGTMMEILTQISEYMDDNNLSQIITPKGKILNLQKLTDELFKYLEKYPKPNKGNVMEIIKEGNYPSKYDIDDKVTFIPMQRHCNTLSIEKEEMYGTITAVRFTKAKVFYDIIDDYHGYLFDNVDSVNVKKEDKVMEMYNNINKKYQGGLYNRGAVLIYEYILKYGPKNYDKKLKMLEEVNKHISIFEISKKEIDKKHKEKIEKMYNSWSKDLFKRFPNGSIIEIGDTFYFFIKRDDARKARGKEKLARELSFATFDTSI